MAKKIKTATYTTYNLIKLIYMAKLSKIYVNTKSP